MIDHGKTIQLSEVWTPSSRAVPKLMVHFFWRLVRNYASREFGPTRSRQPNCDYRPRRCTVRRSLSQPRCPDL